MSSAPRGNWSEYVHPDGYIIEFDLASKWPEPRRYRVTGRTGYIGVVERRIARSSWTAITPVGVEQDGFKTRGDATDWLIERDLTYTNDAHP